MGSDAWYLAASVSRRGFVRKGPPRAPGMTVVVRDMHVDDLPSVAAIEAASFSDAWAPSAFADLLARTHARLRVATSADGTVLGYCILLRAADEGEIANICAAAVVRGQGVGGTLLDDALAAADASVTAAVYLEVRTSNVAARALYEGRGFSLVGRRKGYYQHPNEDALVLRRTHPAAP
ncbi:ribosomal protein S18-alanine N-acetyltransferase [Gemmatimonas sp.]|uniref:ribosomal protein S18-alanine N-acetyltransferase n=1 Tax=Gemmatimonas sp. TaxID=1962908 RepID=UPI003DA52EA0